MQVIRIASLTGGETKYTSFSLDSLSEIKAEEDYVYLFFKSLVDSSFVSSSYYYGTRVKFTKTGLGYQLYQQIILSLTNLEGTKIVTLDYTTDSLVTISFEEIYGPAGGGGGTASAVGIFSDSGEVTSGATGIYFTGSGVTSVVASGDFVTVTITASRYRYCYSYCYRY